jgi:hypothetical protein
MNNNTNLNINTNTQTTSSQELTAEEAPSTTQTNFESENVQIKVGLPDTNIYASYEMQTIREMLARPVLTDTIAWTNATVAGGLASFANWRAATPILRRLINYKFMRGTIHVKFVFDSTPYHYGMMVLAVQPYLTNNWDVASNLVKCRISQLPNVRIYAHDSIGGEIVVPLTSPFINLLVTTSAESTLAANLLYFPVSTLSRADGGTVGTININVYVWLTDSMLSMPTSVVATSTSKEVGTNEKLSHVVNNIGQNVQKLKNVPIIGSIANVAGGIVKTVGNVAAFFGFSSPIETMTVSQVISRSVDNMAVTDEKATIRKLALTKTQQTNVGNKYLVGAGEDSMAIMSIASIDSIIAHNTWATTDAVGTLIANFPVNPFMVLQDGATKQLPAISACSLPFTYYSGSLIFRIDIICSTFHKGRLLISYHPVTNEASSGEAARTTQSSCIVDISAETVKDFQIYGSSPTGVDLITANSFSVSGTGVSVPACESGVIQIWVEASLLAPATTASVDIVTSVRAGPDFKVYCPTNYNLYNLGYGNVKATSLSVELGAKHKLANVPLCKLNYNLFSEEDASIFFGEEVTSFRQVLKRFVYEGAATVEQLDSPATFMTKLFKIYLSAGPQLPTTTLSGATFGNHDYHVFAPNLLGFIGACFMGYRGSTRVKVFPIISHPSDTLLIYSVNKDISPAYSDLSYRSSSDFMKATYAVNLTTGIFPSTAANIKAPQRELHDAFPSMMGSAMEMNNKPIEVEIPYYSNRLYLSTSPNSNEALIYSGGANKYSISGMYQNFYRGQDGFLIFKAIGDDFNFFFWQGITLPNTIAGGDTLGQVTLATPT